MYVSCHTFSTKDTYTLVQDSTSISKQHLRQPSKKKHTDLQVLLQVVEQNHLKHQLLSSDDVGWNIQGQEEVLEHYELQNIHMKNCHISS